MSRLHKLMIGAGVFAGTLSVGVVSAFAQTDTTAVTNGTNGLTPGVDTLTSFLYAALPILIGLAVAAAIVRWVYRRITSGAH